MQVREGLQRLEGVESVGERPDIQKQTCEIRPRPGWLPDSSAVSRHLAGLGLGARLRGIEAVVEGEVRDADGTLTLGSPAGEALRLAPLQQIVQWDFSRQRPYRPSRAERRAFARLREKLSNGPRQARLTGTLITAPGRSPVLEVRRFDMDLRSDKR